MLTETAENEVAVPDPQALAMLPPAERAALALKADETEKNIRAMVERTSAITTAVDKNGRREAHSSAMMLMRVRTTITRVGKMAREDATAFQKAVIAKEKDLIEMITPEESRLTALYEAFDQKEADEKAERERLAKERADAIDASMSAIRNLPGGLIGAMAVEITEVLRALAQKEATEAEFGERSTEALFLIDQTGRQLHTMLESAVAREQAEVQRQQELERLRAEAAEATRKAEEAEAQRLREEQERREELERSTRAQVEAMAAQKRQEAFMAEIMAVQNLGIMIADARGIDAALEKARDFDPTMFGAMEPMAKMAKDLAVSNLEQRLARVLELEIPAVIDEAFTMHNERDHIMLLRDPEPELAMPSHAQLLAVHDIDWDEPAPAAKAPPMMPIARIVSMPDADSALAEFRRVLTLLRGFYSDAEVIAFFNEEMAVMAGRY